MWNVLRVVAVLLVLVPSVALAHPNVDEARRLYEEAEFAASSAQLDEAEASDTLTREDLVRVLELRMFLHLATGGQAALEHDLTRILAVDPSYQGSDEAPPEVAEMLGAVRERLGGPISVGSSAELSGSVVRVDAQVENDAAEITREVRITARVGDGEPSVGGSPLGVPVESGDVVSYWAEALGPGGAVLASDGSASAPLLFPPDGQPLTMEGGDDATGWIILGVVVGILVAGGAVTVGVVLGTDSGPSDNTQPSLPMIAMP